MVLFVFPVLLRDSSNIRKMIMAISLWIVEEGETGLQWAKDWMEEEEDEIETISEVLCWRRVGEGRS